MDCPNIPMISRYYLKCRPMPRLSNTQYSISVAPQTSRVVIASSLILLFCLIFYFSLASANQKPVSAAATPSLAPLYETLAPKLREGKLFMYAVPFSTEGKDDTSQPNWWKNCATTSPISAEGMQMARTIFTALTKLGVTVGFVNSGEYCTALTSATYVSGRALNFFMTSTLDSPEIQRKSNVPDGVIEQHILSFFRASIPNTLTINMGAKLTPTTAPHPVMTDLAPGETALFEVLPTGELQLAAKLNWRQWAEMANYIAGKNPPHSRAKSKHRKIPSQPSK